MAHKTQRAKLVELIADGLISTLLDMAEDAASDFVEEVMDDESLVWNRLKIDITPDIIAEEHAKLAYSILKEVTFKLAMEPVNDAEDWADVRDKHPRQLMLL